MGDGLPVELLTVRTREGSGGSGVSIPKRTF